MKIISAVDENLENMMNDELTDACESAAQAVLASESIDSEYAEVSLTVVSDSEIRRLNKEFRNVDKETDVLSFPQYESAEQVRDAVRMASKASGAVLIGDVVIALTVCQKQAEQYGHSLKREFVYLFVHSMFHLLGYDHMQESERKIMREKEDLIMNKLGITRNEQGEKI